MYVGDGSLGIGFIVIFMHLDKRSIQLVNHIFQNIACQNINKAFKFVSNVQWTSSLTVWSLIKNNVELCCFLSFLHVSSLNVLMVSCSDSSIACPMI